MRHTQSRFPFPLVRPSFTAESLRGWWDGVVGREGQQQHRATTPTATPPLSRTPCGLRSHLEPSVAVAEAVRRTGNRRPTTGQTTTGDNETDNSSSGSGKATGSAAAEAEPDNSESRSSKTRAAGEERQKLQHSKRQCRSSRPAASAAGRDRHPPRRVLHTPSGKASAAARVARRPHLHSAHLRAE